MVGGLSDTANDLGVGGPVGCPGSRKARMDVCFRKAEGIGERLHEGRPRVLESNTSLDIGLDRAHRDPLQAAVGHRSSQRCDAMMEFKRRADVDPCPVGHDPAAECHADGGQETGAAEDAMHARMRERPSLEHFQGRRETLLEPLDAEPHVVASQAKVGHRGKESHTHLPRTMQHATAAAAGKPQRELPRHEFLIGKKNIGPRSKPADRDAGLQLEDQERGAATVGECRLAGELFGE